MKSALMPKYADVVLCLHSWLGLKYNEHYHKLFAIDYAMCHLINIFSFKVLLKINMADKMRDVFTYIANDGHISDDHNTIMTKCLTEACKLERNDVSIFFNTAYLDTGYPEYNRMIK